MSCDHALTLRECHNLSVVESEDVITVPCLRRPTDLSEIQRECHLPELWHPRAFPAGSEQSLAPLRARLFGEPGRGLGEVSPGKQQFRRLLGLRLCLGSVLCGPPALTEEKDVAHGQLPLRSGKVVRLENVVPNTILLQRHVGGEDIEQTVLGPLLDERGTECCRAQVRHGESEGGELHEGLATGFRQPEKIDLGECDRAHLNGWGSRLATCRGERRC